MLISNIIGNPNFNKKLNIKVWLQLYLFLTNDLISEVFVNSYQNYMIPEKCFYYVSYIFLQPQVMII